MGNPELQGIQIPPSDEVVAYPKILKFMRVDFIQCAIDEVDNDRRHGFMLAAVLVRGMFDDIRVCREIEQHESFRLPYHCKSNKSNEKVTRPRYF